jgi:hypothetical protein
MFCTEAIRRTKNIHTSLTFSCTFKSVIVPAELPLEGIVFEG